MDYEVFYNKLFEKLESKYGKLDDETITSIVGFSAGGPVSLSKIGSKNLFVSCELASYPEQQKSSEGLNFEFFSVGKFSEDWCRSVFTALGGLSFDAELGNEHRINISGLVEGPETVDQIRLKLFCQTKIDGKKYGLYEVLAD
ncbi:hypothetical protein [Aliikangiella sp. IMCC44632]